MSITFSGINIHAKDPVKSFEFYKGIGLPVKTEAALDDNWYGAEFDIGGSILWIWRDHAGASCSVNPPIQIVLNCTDIKQSFTELKSAGYDVTEPELMFYNGWEMNLTDPDGNKILFLG